MKSSILLVLVIGFCNIAFCETHWNLQQIDASGIGTHPDLVTNNFVTVEGIILNRPDYMLNVTPDANSTIPFDLGGQWQIFVQGTGTDHAGTAIWLGQNYGNLPFVLPEIRYTDAQWMAEVFKISRDPNQLPGYVFMPGDKVRVTGKIKYFGGKTNINERHETDPLNDITIELVEAGVGLPVPELLSLDELKDGGDAFLFDSTRMTGCEYYQSRLIRINDVSFADASGWGPDGEVVITDGVRTFPVHLGIGPGITASSNNLNSSFDVIGILNQEGSDTAGYEIWVVNYDGNGNVLADLKSNDLYYQADLNYDGIVNTLDLQEMALNWLDSVY